MAKVVVYGITGFTGGNIAREAIARGHQVTGVARNVDDFSLPGATTVTGDIGDLAHFKATIAGSDVVVLALRHSSPRIVDLIIPLAKATEEAGTRLAVVGGAGSLYVSQGGPRLIDTPEFPDAYKVEAGAALETLLALEANNVGKWFYVSPAGLYGSFAPGTRTGHYRLGGDVLVTDAEGKSVIGGEDFAIAFVDEIEKNAHPNQRFTVGY
ncbi:MAG: hypothetical protein RL243_2 [Actinomycetota bacterium]